MPRPLGTVQPILIFWASWKHQRLLRKCHRAESIQNGARGVLGNPLVTCNSVNLCDREKGLGNSKCHVIKEANAQHVLMRKGSRKEEVLLLCLCTFLMLFPLPGLCFPSSSWSRLLVLRVPLKGLLSSPREGCPDLTHN